MYSTYVLVNILLPTLQQEANLEIYFYIENTETCVHTQADFTFQALKFCSFAFLLH